MHRSKTKLAPFFALLAAALYAISSPFSKLLLKELSPTMMAAFLYLGAGFGMTIVGIVRKHYNLQQQELKLTKNELP